MCGRWWVYRIVAQNPPAPAAPTQDDGSGGKEQDVVEFQMLADNSKILRCAKETIDVQDASKFKFENLHMSFQGTDIDSGDRKFRLSPKLPSGEVDEDGIYFEFWESLADGADTPAAPSKTYSPRMPTMAVSSYEEYKQSLVQADIDTWLANELFGAYTDANLDTYANADCAAAIGLVNKGVEVPEVPAIINYYNENPAKVRTYAAMIEQFSIQYADLVAQG